MPKVSIVVPVYNVEKYIELCLGSILEQTLTDIEIICIDDGSTDKSGVILDKYAQKDSRIKVIHKMNTGYGDSVNTGFDIAQGEYIGIVESDDVIKPEMYESLYTKAKQNNLDIIKSNALFWWSNINYYESTYREDLDEFYDILLEPVNRKIMFQFYMNTWTGIYKKEFLQKYNIRHNTTTGASYQDNGFWLQTLCFCERAMWLKEAYYCYRQDNPEASIKSKNKIYAMLNEYNYASGILKNRVGKIEWEMCNYFRMVRHRGNFYRIDDTLKREFCNTILKEYDKYTDFVRHDENLNNWFEMICENPDEVCSRILDKKNTIMNALENCKQIIVYGAGVRGKAVIKRLNNLNFIKKVSAIVVTNKTESEKIGTIPIFSFDEFNGYDEKTLFVIAVSEKTDAYSSILQKIKEKNITNYMGNRDLVELFYSVN